MAPSSISKPTPVNDALDEADETFRIQLTGAVGAVLGAAQQQIITIADDDPPPSLTINDVTTNEAAGTANFTSPCQQLVASRSRSPTRCQRHRRR